MTAESEQGASPDVAVGVLGSLEVHVDGTPTRIGHARRKAVLVVLLVEANRVVTADRLIDRVWGEHAPGRSRSVLRTYLSHLRRALAGTGITITWRDTGYRLTADADRVDLHRFRRLLARARDSADPRGALALADEALALWRGEPLAELDTPWAQSVREHLRRERAAARADRTDWALECGRHGEVLPDLTAQAAEHPLDERTAEQVMLALYRSGRQADALEHYQHTRQRLVEELGTDPGPALQGLHQRILTADPTLTLPEPVPHHRAGPTPAPRQLPAAPTPFVGRHDELDRLNTALTTAGEVAGTMLITAIGGAGGIGKTWLTLRWAHSRLDRFPDGQLFVDLRGFSPEGEPMDPAVAVRGFLGALGVDPGRMPVEPHAQAALFRTLVADKRMLIVLDNAADTTQITPLLPGTRTCTVVVTSRNRLRGLITGHGARHLALDVLTDAEARALLADRLGADRVDAEPDVVAELIGKCDGFPLALGIIAAHAHARPRLPLAAIAAELRDLGIDALDSDDPTASLPAVLSWSDRVLTPRWRRVLALVAIAPGPDIGLPAAASLTGLPLPQARKALHTLEDAFLLSRDAHGRYIMHDLIRTHAAALADDVLDEPARKAALERVVDFYLHTAHTAATLLDPYTHPISLDPPAPGVYALPLLDDQAALAWLDAEHRPVLAAQHSAVAHQRHQVAWQLAWTLDTFHGRRGHRHDRLAVWRTAVDAAANLPDPVTGALAHRRLGAAHARLGQHEEASRNLHQALTLAEHHHDTTHQAHIHRDLAWAWGLRGDDQRALEHARRALDLYDTLDLPSRKALVLNTVGWFTARLGDYDTARLHCQAALTLHREHHDPAGEAADLDSLGYIDHHTGQHHHQAADHYRKALAIRRALGHAYEVADTLDHLGHPCAALGDHEQASAAWREALELYRQQGRDTDAERVRRQLDALE